MSITLSCMSSLTKSCLLDPILTFLLKELIDLFLPYITAMVNSSIRPYFMVVYLIYMVKLFDVVAANNATVHFYTIDGQLYASNQSEFSCQPISGLCVRR